MGLCFLNRQLEHCHTLLRLAPHRDSALVARSMLEGLCLLLWASKDKNRALQWRAFAYVHDFRMANSRAVTGQAPDTARDAAIGRGLDEYGHLFLTKKARHAKGQSQRLPEDPYCKDWRAGVTLKDAAYEVGAEQLYEELYAPLSDWAHWGTSGFGSALARDADRVRYEPHSAQTTASALALAFQCLLQSMQCVGAHLDLGYGPRVDSIRSAFIAEFWRSSESR